MLTNVSPMARMRNSAGVYGKDVFGVECRAIIPYFLEAESLTEPEISVLTSWPAATPPPVGSV